MGWDEFFSPTNAISNEREKIFRREIHQQNCSKKILVYVLSESNTFAFYIFAMNMFNPNLPGPF